MTYQDLWNLTYTKLKESLPDHAINTWFEPIVPIAVTEDELILEVPNQFFFEWIDSHYREAVSDALKEVTNKKTRHRFIVSTQRQTKELEETKSEINSNQSKTQYPPNINKQYTFESFIEGSNNEFAKTAAQSVAQEPGKSSFNPLIIYGGVGLGKTHLLHAIANRVVEKNNMANVVIVTSEKFTLDFVNSLRKNRTIEFAQQYRNSDVLLIDDIQFFRGKEQTQEQFFHTFNVLYQSGKQIVMTADKYPGEMKGLKERLLSRFQSGLSVDVQPPNFEIRVAILLDKAEQNGLALDYDIIEFIARHIKNNVRDLEGAIIRILAKSSLMNRVIDFSLVKDVIKERVGSSFTADLSIEDIVRKVSDVSRIPEKEIIGKSRKMELVEARQVYMYLCRDIMGISLKNIGVYYGGMDTTTVKHAVKTINKKSLTDVRLQKMVESLKQELDFTFV